MGIELFMMYSAVLAASGTLDASSMKPSQFTSLTGSLVSKSTDIAKIGG